MPNEKTTGAHNASHSVLGEKKAEATSNTVNINAKSTAHIYQKKICL